MRERAFRAAGMAVAAICCLSAATPLEAEEGAQTRQTSAVIDTGGGSASSTSLLALTAWGEPVIGILGGTGTEDRVGWIHTLGGNAAPRLELPDQEMDEDTTAEVDLDDFAQDADGDDLGFRLLQPGDAGFPSWLPAPPAFVRLVDPQNPGNPNPPPDRATRLIIAPPPDWNDELNPIAPGVPFPIAIEVDDGKGLPNSKKVVVIDVSVKPLSDPPAPPTGLLVAPAAVGTWGDPRSGRGPGQASPAVLVGDLLTTESAAIVFSAVFQDPDADDAGTAYRIQVGTGPDEADISSLWDSGGWAYADERGGTRLSRTPRGTRTLDIAYQGGPMRLDTDYWWRIRFQDEDGSPGPWSDPASFRITRNVHQVADGSENHVTRFRPGGWFCFRFAGNAGRTVTVRFLARRSPDYNGLPPVATLLAADGTTALAQAQLSNLGLDLGEVVLEAALPTPASGVLGLRLEHRGDVGFIDVDDLDVDEE